MSRGLRLTLQTHTVTDGSETESDDSSAVPYWIHHNALHTEKTWTTYYIQQHVQKIQRSVFIHVRAHYSI